MHFQRFTTDGMGVPPVAERSLVTPWLARQPSSPRRISAFVSKPFGLPKNYKTWKYCGTCIEIRRRSAISLEFYSSSLCKNKTWKAKFFQIANVSIHIAYIYFLSRYTRPPGFFKQTFRFNKNGPRPYPANPLRFPRGKMTKKKQGALTIWRSQKRPQQAIMPRLLGHG